MHKEAAAKICYVCATGTGQSHSLVAFLEQYDRDSEELIMRFICSHSKEYVSTALIAFQYPAKLHSCTEKTLIFWHTHSVL